MPSYRFTQRFTCCLLVWYRRAAAALLPYFIAIVTYPFTKSQFFGYDRFHKKESLCYPVGLVTCIITEFLLIFSLSHMSCSLTLTVAGVFYLY